MRRKATERGTWFTVRHVDGIECWVGTHAAEVSDHLQSLPATTLPVLLGCDVNSEVTWGLDDQGDPVVAPGNGKTLEFFSARQVAVMSPSRPTDHAQSMPPDREFG